MFAAVYFEESFIRSNLPTVEEFFNVFHPSDLIANRLEPLVKSYVYPDRSRRSFATAGMSLERGVSHIELNAD